VDQESFDKTLDLVQEALGDRYVVTGALAQGGMSLLLRGRQNLLDQPVAIKVMSEKMVGNRELRERFIREARILASLQVPQITRVYDAGALKDGRLYLVLELLQGENLETISERAPVPVNLAAKLLMQVCDGLIPAHDRGIIHRDLKPENVFIVTSESGELIAKLLDFGIAKDTSDTQDVTGAFTIVGSPLYVPPEQIVSSRTVDRRADIWAMGIMLYQLVLQRHPFEDPSLALLLHKIQNEPLPPFPPDSDPMFEIIVERCLAKRPEDRYQTAQELKEALASLAEATPPIDLDDLPTIGPRPAPVRAPLGEMPTEPPPSGLAPPVSVPTPALEMAVPAQQPRQRIVQKTIPIGRPFVPTPAPTPAEPIERPRAPRGGHTVPLLGPYTGPVAPELQAAQAQAAQAQAAQAARAAEAKLAVPLPAARRQAPTVIVPQEPADRPMWPFVAFGVAIVLAVVAVALVLVRQH